MFKIELNKEMLEKKLGVSCSIIGKGSRLPILNENLFRFSAERMEILSNNEEIEIITSMPYELIEGKVLNFVCQGYVIMQTLKFLKTETITIQIVSVPNGKLEKVIFGTPKNKKQYEIPCNYDADSFPADKNEEDNEATPPIVLSGAFLSESFNTVSKIVNTSDIRPALTGVYIGKIDKHLCIQAFDSKTSSSMFRIKKDMEQDFKEVIVPKSTLIPMQFFLTSNEVKISVSKDKRKIRFDDGSIVVYSRLIDGKYPDIQRVFNEYISDNEIKINRQELLGVVNRCGIFSDMINNSIVLDSRKEAFEISSKDTNFNKSSIEEIEITSKSDTFKFRTSFNAEMFKTAVSPFSGENIIITQKNDNSGIIITDDKERDYSIHALLMHQNV